MSRDPTTTMMMMMMDDDRRRGGVDGDEATAAIGLPVTAVATAVAVTASLVLFCRLIYPRSTSAGVAGTRGGGGEVGAEEAVAAGVGGRARDAAAPSHRRRMQPLSFAFCPVLSRWGLGDRQRPHGPCGQWGRSLATSVELLQ